mmetsp:Transcript_56044/g.98273  ORF Transcript_56044/g.98273 Transcript_56044/m.98273 type:complete len:299 (-) Transcript_56044:1079-1975(-)
MDLLFALRQLGIVINNLGDGRGTVCVQHIFEGLSPLVRVVQHTLLLELHQHRVDRLLCASLLLRALRGDLFPTLLLVASTAGFLHVDHAAVQVAVVARRNALMQLASALHLHEGHTEAALGVRVRAQTHLHGSFQSRHAAEMFLDLRSSHIVAQVSDKQHIRHLLLHLRHGLDCQRRLYLTSGRGTCVGNSSLAGVTISICKDAGDTGHTPPHLGIHRPTHVLLGQHLLDALLQQAAHRRVTRDLWRFGTLASCSGGGHNSTHIDFGQHGVQLLRRVHGLQSLQNAWDIVAVAFFLCS